MKVLFQSDADRCATETQTIDLAEQAEFRENKGLIKDVVINDISMVITNANVNGNNQATQADGSVFGSKVDSADSFAIGTYGAMKIEQGFTQTVQVDGASQKHVKALILGDESRINVIGSACADKLPYSFEAEITVNFTFTAGVI